MKCIYHNDMDGRCAGFLVAKFTGNKNPEDYMECDYNHFPIDCISKEEVVYIVDYSFTESTIEFLGQLIHVRKCKVIWIDHHTSSIELSSNPSYRWIKDIDGIRDDRLSGAGLVYSYFMNGGVINVKHLPTVVQLVDDYDRWVYRLGDNTIYFKLGLETVDFDALDPIWDELYESDEKCDSIIATGAIIKQFIDKDNAVYLSSFGYESEIAGIPCLVVNRCTNSWIFGDKINSYSIVVVWVFDGIQYRYSIYSSDESIDCSKIAESYGGGGHKGAAGFRSDKLLFSKK